MRASKYKSVKTVIDGLTFDSKLEATRYSELKLLERAGEITHLKLQPRFPVTINDVKICTYIADFRYREGAFDNMLIVEDVKGFKTPVYRLKKKMVEAQYGIEIVEVTK